MPKLKKGPEDMNIVYVSQADETLYNLRLSLDLYDDWFQTYNSLNYEALTMKKEKLDKSSRYL